MAGRIRDEDVAAVRERTDIVKLVSGYLTLKKAGHDRFVGAVPVPHREDAIVRRLALQAGLLLLRLRRGRRRDRVPPRRRAPRVLRGGRAAGQGGRCHPPLRGRDARRTPRRVQAPGAASGPTRPRRAVPPHAPGGQGGGGGPGVPRVARASTASVRRVRDRVRARLSGLPAAAARRGRSPRSSWSRPASRSRTRRATSATGSAAGSRSRSTTSPATRSGSARGSCPAARATRGRST